MQCCNNTEGVTQTKKNQEIECEGCYSVLSSHHLYNVLYHVSIMACVKSDHLKWGCVLSTYTGTLVTQNTRVFEHLPCICE